jgi:D-xylose transport system permease protein
MSAQTDEIVEQDEPGRGEPTEGLAALRTYIRGYVARVLGGELGSIPALVGLIVIAVVFAVLHQGFLSAFNIEALVIQAAPIIVMAMGLVFVLLLGEIDLSAGTTGGLCSAITAVLILRQGAPWWLALIAGLVAGLAIGFGMGWLRARLGIPSFVVTLATFLAAAVGAVERRRRQHAAAGRRRGRDRRHLTVRRLRSRHRRRSRRPGRRGRHQRHERPHPGCELGGL